MVIEKILFIIYFFNKNKKKLVSLVWNLKYFKVIQCVRLLMSILKGANTYSLLYICRINKLNNSL